MNTSKLRSHITIYVISLTAIALSSCAPAPRRVAARQAANEVPSSPFQVVALDKVPTTLPETVRPSERAAVEKSTAELSRLGFKALSCRYFGDLGTNQRTENAYFWYERVGAPQKQLVFISPGHPLAGLGDKPRSACPATRAEAKALIDEMFPIYSRYTYDRDDAGWATPEDPAAPKPVSCVAFANTQTIRNGCGFAVVYKWCAQRSARPCIPGFQDYLPAGMSKTFRLGSVTALRVQACPEPYVPQLPERFNSENWMGLPWRCVESRR